MIQRFWSKTWVRVMVYSGWTTLFFLMSLIWTYPGDALVEEVSEAVRKSGALAHFDARDASISGLGVALEGVEIVTESGDANLPWRIDRVRVGLASFTTDVQSAALNFDVEAYGGSISGLVGKGALRVDLDGVELGRAMPLQKIIPTGLAGAAHGQVAMSYGEKVMRTLQGTIDLTLRSAAIGPGDVPIPGFGSSLSLPKATVGDLPLKIGISSGELELEPFKVTGGDVELAGEGTMRLVFSRIMASSMDLEFDVRPTDKLKATQEGKNLLTALDPKSPLLPRRIKRAFSKSGWLGVSVGGRLRNPRVQVRRSNVK